MKRKKHLSVSKKKVKEPLIEYVDPGVEYEIINGDALKELNKFEDDKFDLIITSPPYNVGKANWEESNGSLKIIIELRDVNYPGSTYTLSYLPDRDVLAGDYYQAVEGITFYVEFARN
jgi:DNA modification methylase